MVKVDLDHVYKKYDNATDHSVTDFNLHINDHEFIVFVDPSGRGKSTTLGMIVELEEISEGTLKIGGKVMNDIAPEDWQITMVFQNYALYPHMSVYDNMAFGLKLHHYSKEEIDKKVKSAAEVLGLAHLLDRKPAALSGGQHQRVALGRAIVRDVSTFLMDEPLSNLDVRLRVSMRAEIVKLHQELKTTIIYVTHDQTEAMTSADRIVVLKDGRTQQVGSPLEVYNKSANVFVIGFIGSPAMNFFRVTLKDGKITDKNNQDFAIPVPEGKLEILKEKGCDNKEIIFGIRPEDVHIEKAFLQAFPEAAVNATIAVSELLGSETQLYAKVGESELVSRVNVRDFTKPGSMVRMGFEMNKAHFFDAETELTID